MSDWELVKENNPSQSEWEVSNENDEQNTNESYPKKIARSIGIGLGNMGHSILNAPHDIASTFEQKGKEFKKGLKPLKMDYESMLADSIKNQVEEFNRKHNVPESMKNPNFGKSVSELIPHQQEYNFAEMLGQKGDPSTSEWLIQKGTEHLPDILGATALYRSLPIALTRRGAARELRQARNLAQERNINNLNIPDEIMEDIPQFLPTTRPYQRLIEEAGQGGYDPLFAIQSDLGEAGRGFARNPFSFAERRHGREAGRTRERLLNSMREELENQGHLDIANLMRRGQQRYRNYSRLKNARNIGLTLGAIKTPYGRRLLKAIGLID